MFVLPLYHISQFYPVYPLRPCSVFSDMQLVCSTAWLSPLFNVVQGKLTASAVGSIVGMQSEEIQQIASEYAEKVSYSPLFRFLLGNVL